MPSFAQFAFWGFALAMLSGPPALADEVQAINTAGLGVLTMCRSWLIFNQCKDYYRVAIPPRIAIGDRVEVAFGSNPKEYRFPVVRIVREMARCTVYSEANGNMESVDRIVVDGCTVP